MALFPLHKNEEKVVEGKREKGRGGSEVFSAVRECVREKVKN